MSTILHIDCSVTGDKSVTRPLTAEVAKHLRELHPDARYIYRDLVKDSLQHYTAVQRLYGADPTHVPTEVQRQEIATGKQILEEFMSADIVVLAAPMYNFN